MVAEQRFDRFVHVDHVVMVPLRSYFEINLRLYFFVTIIFVYFLSRDSVPEDFVNEGVV